MTTKKISKVKTLILVGTSGSGKTHLKEQLIENFPKVFSNVEQVSTRSPRNDQDKSYDFIDDVKYDEIVNTLTCKTNFNGHRYGSKIDKFDKKKVNILVASEEGFHDYVNSEVAKNHEYITLVLDRYDYAGIGEIRSDRDVEFLASEHASCERTSQHESAYTWDVTINGFIDNETVFDLVQNKLNGVSSASVRVDRKQTKPTLQ